MDGNDTRKMEEIQMAGAHQSSDTFISKVGERPAGLLAILLISAYLISLSTNLLYVFVNVWPNELLGADKAAPLTVTLYSFPLSISHEVSLISIVIAAGGLGSTIHGIRSLYWYIGNRGLRQSWIAKYLMQPFVGASLALIFYFVIRAGFFSPQAKSQDISAFGFAAMSGLVGLFSEQAVLKLKSVAETLLTKVEPGKDSKPQEHVPQK